MTYQKTEMTPVYLLTTHRQIRTKEDAALLQRDLDSLAEWEDRRKRFILRKRAYTNILRILPPKNENFQMKNSGSFHISAQNINCGYLLEPPRRGEASTHNLFLSRNKTMYTPVNQVLLYENRV